MEKELAMKDINETNLLNYEGLEYLVGKYKERNPISKFLIGNFYRTIESIIQYLEPSDRVLEVGCGAGISSVRIQQMLHGQLFEVSDVDENVIRQFSNINFPIPFQQESALQLNRKNGEFNCIFLLEVLEHIPDYRKALSEVFRVSNKYVVISTPNEPLWRILNMLRGKYVMNWGNTPDHVNHWSTSALTNLIGEYGKIEKVYRPLPWTIVLAKVQPDSSNV